MLMEVGMTKPSAKASGRCSRSASSVAALAAGAAGVALLLRPRLRWGMLLVVIFSCVMLRRSAMVLVRRSKNDEGATYVQFWYVRACVHGMSVVGHWAELAPHFSAFAYF